VKDETGGHSHFPARLALVTCVPGMEGMSSTVALSLIPWQLILALAHSSCMWYFLFIFLFYFILLFKKKLYSLPATLGSWHFGLGCSDLCYHVNAFCEPLHGLALGLNLGIGLWSLCCTEHSNAPLWARPPWLGACTKLKRGWKERANSLTYF